MAYTDSEDLNFLGMLFASGNRRTPFLNLLGSPIDDQGNINSSVLKTVTSFEFSIAQSYDVGAGAQPAITEAQSVTGITATTVTRGQDVQTCQIFMDTAEVSYKKLSTTGTMSFTTPSSHNIDGAAPGMGFGVAGNPIMDELDFQTTQRLVKMANDLNASVIGGTYQGAISVSQAAKMRGISTAITTNTVAAGTTALSTTHVNAVLKKMVDAGAQLNRLIALCNSFQRQSLGALYECVPQSRTEGGSQIMTVYTDFGTFDIFYDPYVTTSELVFVDLSFVKLVCCPVQGKYVVVEDKETDGASYKRQIYTQLSVDYGPEEMHGKITGLTTS